MKNYFLIIISISVLFNNSCISQENPPLIETPDQTKYATELIVDGIDIPWGMDFINETEFLVTDKKGILYHVKNGVKTEVSGLPKVYVRGQGGLLDVALHPNFKSNKIVYLAISVNLEGDEGGNTAIYSGTFEKFKINNMKLLYKAVPNTKKGQHFGSRIVFDDKGHLFFGVGDRGNRDVNPQDIKNDGGKIYRLNLDGSIPDDNPFVNKQGAKKAVYSYGNRNPQGLIFHPITGELWEHEHGPKGGDEINIIEKGKNYGWPVITYGINYSGTSITDKREMPGMEQPLYYWVPSIAPSGMAFSTSDIYKDWKGDLFVGSLKFKYLERLVIRDKKVIKREKILDEIGRVRNVKEGPDGYLYIGVDGKGILKVILEE
ncbi:MAG: PQQ-dependent sugar dehydrogenase [Bacteroidota bacterium]|nr:PQQ-dependent sugar dehydrogenase [Bacteroidota bacterium]